MQNEQCCLIIYHVFTQFIGIRTNIYILTMVLQNFIHSIRSIAERYEAYAVCDLVSCFFLLLFMSRSTFFKCFARAHHIVCKINPFKNIWRVVQDLLRTRLMANSHKTLAMLFISIYAFL